MWLIGSELSGTNQKSQLKWKKKKKQKQKQTAVNLYRSVGNIFKVCVLIESTLNGQLM